MNLRHDIKNSVGIRKGKGRLMQQVKHGQRDSGDGLGSKCEAGDCQGQLGRSAIKKVVMRKDYTKISRTSSVRHGVLYDTLKYSASDINTAPPRYRTFSGTIATSFYARHQFEYDVGSDMLLRSRAEPRHTP